MVRYVAILLSSMQFVEEFQMALKNFYVVFKQPITSKNKDVM